MKYFLKTFGCQQNKADSERVAGAFRNRGFSEAKDMDEANYVIINTCMVRRSAEDRVYGLVKNLGELKRKRGKKHFFKIIVTGCMVGLAFRDSTGAYLSKIKQRMPEVDEFLPIEEVGFDIAAHRLDSQSAWVPISNGCNNFCTFCIVPFTRGREISRPFEDILTECRSLKEKGCKRLTLLGQNVNSYGADLIVGKENVQVMRDLNKTYFESPPPKTARAALKGQSPLADSPDKLGKPVYVKHLGRYRIPTLFPHLLSKVAALGFEQVEFFSSNPWDFTDELIKVIARHENITRTIHLPVQSGDDNVLKRMNRWYTREQYLKLVSKLKNAIPKLRLTTDIIVGFCGETDEEFKNTVTLSKQAAFEKAYISIYSKRPMTSATKLMDDDVPHKKKKERWQLLEDLINKPHLTRRIVS